jgi:PhnB protein
MGVDESSENYKSMQGVSIAAEIKTPEEAERVFKDLSAGGNVGMPIAETFFAHRFGILTDKYGIAWMINCEKKMG